MIVCLIRADWGEQGAREGKKTVKDNNLLMVRKIQVTMGGAAIKHTRLYNPICSVKSSNKKGFERSNIT